MIARAMNADTTPMRQIMERYRDAYNERDWTALDEVFAPDIHWVDRRLVSWGEGSGRDALNEILRAQLDLAPDMTLTDAQMVASGQAAYLTRNIYRGHFRAAEEEVEIGLAILTCVADGQIAEFELFHDTSLADALARFEEIGAPTEPERVLARLCRSVNSRDWDAVADLYTEDFTSIDRRPLGWEPMRGGRAIADFYRSWVDVVPDLELRFTLLTGDASTRSASFSAGDMPLRVAARWST